jgi:hypothetical protein
VLTPESSSGSAAPGGQTNAFAGSYSPDGRWIVLRRESAGGASLMKVRPDGRDLTPILSIPDFARRFIAWGPESVRSNS